MPNKVDINVANIQFVRELMDQFQLSVMKQW